MASVLNLFDPKARVKTLQLSCRFKRGNLQVGPPCHFVAVTVQFIVVLAAKRHSEFITNFKTQGASLRKLQVMRI